MNKPTQKTALITGAGSGIGKAICVQLAAAGHRIIAVSRNVEHLAEIESALNNSAHVMVNVDLTTAVGKSTLLGALQQNGMPHIVVNNLSTSSTRKKLIQLASNISDEIVTENIRHLFAIMPEVIAFQREQQFGRWIGISSMSPYFGVPGMAIYNMQKAALENCFKTLASEEGKNGITANIIAPGLILTPTVEKNYSTEELALRKKENVMHRIGSPADIAAAVKFLASDDAGYITGITIPVNGGNHLAWQYTH